jgi:hypothetical protein
MSIKTLAVKRKISAKKIVVPKSYKTFRKKKHKNRLFLILNFFPEWTEYMCTVSLRLLNPGLNPSSVVCISAVKRA